jgi:hypothetical protein
MTLRRRPRPRRAIGGRLGAILPYLGFRYSHARQAYVLRGVGRYVGPVLQIRRG